MIITGDAKKLHVLLLELQEAIPVIPKNSTNPHFKSKYADLPTIMEIVMPIFNKLGLVLLQPIHKSDQPNMLEIETIIMAPDGNAISTTATIPIGNNLTPQAFGSAITYARRYVLCSLLGIVADEDDDGNSSSLPGPNQAAVKYVREKRDKEQASSGISSAQAQRLYTIARAAGYSEEEVHAILKKRNIHNAKQLTEENYNKFCQWLEANVKEPNDQ